MSLRGNLYALARLMGDVNAVRRGRVGRRLVNKALGRALVRRFMALSRRTGGGFAIELCRMQL
jgi:hypothetical protein